MLPSVKWGAKDGGPQQTGQFRIPKAGDTIYKLKDVLIWVGQDKNTFSFKEIPVSKGLGLVGHPALLGNNEYFSLPREKHMWG